MFDVLDEFATDDFLEATLAQDAGYVTNVTCDLLFIPQFAASRLGPVESDCGFGGEIWVREPRISDVEHSCADDSSCE